MSFNISSSQLPAGRRQAEVLKLLSATLSAIGKEFFVVGATARDLLAMQLHEESKRKTEDLDITIAVKDWNEFDVVASALTGAGFRRDSKKQQRFYHGKGKDEFSIDVVPYGGIAGKDGKFTWPKDADFEMSVLGFESALKHTVEITVDGEYSFRIPTIPALFILKLISWADRKSRGIYKDAEDMDFLQSIFYLPHSTDDDYIDAYNYVDDGDTFCLGATMIAIAISGILPMAELTELKKIVDGEVAEGPGSKLLTVNISDTKSFETIERAWLCVRSVFEDNFCQNGE